jgi:hypothetical protein
MEAWNGAETADITYDDKEGELTKLLVENGYLDDICSGATPKYYLEVKTTTKECGTRFFVSKSQYQRVRGSRPKKDTWKLMSIDGTNEIDKRTSFL